MSKEKNIFKKYVEISKNRSLVDLIVIQADDNKKFEELGNMYNDLDDKVICEGPDMGAIFKIKKGPLYYTVLVEQFHAETGSTARRFKVLEI